MASGPLQQLAAIAPSLSEVELRVLLELAARAEPPHQTCRVSSRELARSTGSSRRNIQSAIDSLCRRAHLTAREGTAIRAATFRVNFLLLEVASLQRHPPGLVAAPGVTAAPGGGATAAPGGGLAAAPPPTENTQLNFGTPRAIDIDTSDIDTPSVIDRLLQARSKDFSEAEMQRARDWMRSYAHKLPATDNPHPHPPDDTITAQFLSIAEWPRLERLLYELLSERKQCGYNYAWFVSVALQRIHGINPRALKERRAELKLIRNLPKQLAAQMGRMK